MTKPNLPIILKAANYSEGSRSAEIHCVSVLKETSAFPGFVFGVAYSHGEAADLQTFGALLEEHLDRLSQTVDRTTNLSHRFEQFLQALNDDISAASEEGRFTLSIQDTHAVIGLSDEKTILVSGFGNLATTFFHKDEKERYAIYDLARGMRVEEEAASWKKPFLTVLDGTLHAQDVLYVGTRVNRLDMPQGTFNEILTTLPPNGAMSKIRQYLPVDTVFAAIVLKADTADAPVASSEETAGASLESFSQTKEKTEQYLSEQKPDFKALLLKVWRTVFPTSGSVNRRGWPMKMLRLLGKLGWIFLTVAGQILLGVVIGIFTMLKNVFTRPKETFSAIRQSRARLDQGIRSAIGRFNTLPKQSKYALLATLGIACLFVGGILFLNRQKSNELTAEAYEQAVQTVEDKIGSAEASMIYGDEEQARVLLAEAWTLWNTLPTESREEQETADGLKQLMESVADELRHLVNVEATVAADATLSADGAPMRALVELGDATYLVNEAGDVFSVDTAAQTVSRIDATKGEVGAPRAIAASDTSVYWLDTGLTRFSPEGSEITPLTLTRPGVDLAYYGGKLYVLSPESGQVYKHLPTATGFDGGSAWIITGVTDVTDATALAIDGYVWILKTDGQILRYLSGKETEWKVGLVDPSLQGATDIWTDENSSFLYVLDPNQRRVVVFRKDSGTLVTQYTDESFTELRGMIVDEAAKTITVLSGDIVYTFPVAHL